MKEEVSLGNPRPGEWAENSALVRSSGLPLEGLREALDTALVARDGKKVVGVVALELYGPEALFRSLAVVPERRGSGLGDQLTRAVLGCAREHGLTTVYLLTETSAGFFGRCGSRKVSRAEVPDAVRESVEFRSACPSTAEVLARTLV